MHTSRPAGLGPAAEPKFFQQSLNFKSNPADVVPANARTWVEIDSQFIRMIKIAGADRVRMQFDAAEVHDPGEPGIAIDHDLFGSAPGGE